MYRPIAQLVMVKVLNKSKLDVRYIILTTNQLAGNFVRQRTDQYHTVLRGACGMLALSGLVSTP